MPLEVVPRIGAEPDVDAGTELGRSAERGPSRRDPAENFRVVADDVLARHVEKLPAQRRIVSVLIRFRTVAPAADVDGRDTSFRQCLQLTRVRVTVTVPVDPDPQLVKR